MCYMLDTNICVELIRGRAPRVLDRIRQFGVDEIVISSITLAELQYGIARSSNPAKHEILLAEFVAPLDIPAFDDRAAETYGRIRTELERAGTPIGPLDTLIAAHALLLDAVLVNNNYGEFSRVRGLKVENWITS